MHIFMSSKNFTAATSAEFEKPASYPGIRLYIELRCIHLVAIDLFLGIFSYVYIQTLHKVLF